MAQMVAAAAKSLQSNSEQPQRRQPTRLCRPWDSPGKNTGVGCHFLLQCMKVKSESEVARSCPTLCDPPGSSVHGIFQARVLEWVAIAFSIRWWSPPVMHKTCVQSLSGEDPLEEGMAIHSSILAWRIPWTEKLGGRIESDMTEQLTHTHTHTHTRTHSNQ